MVEWKISVIEAGTERGVEGATVYLFLGGGGIEAPELANYTGQTNSEGVAILDVPQDFYRVGIVAINYESAYEPHTPPEEWKAFWTCWGAGGAGHDYPFYVEFIGEEAPPIPLWKVGAVAAAIIGGTGIGLVVVRRKK